MIYKLCLFAVRNLVVCMGNLRDKGHGEFAYMQRRVLADVEKSMGCQKRIFSLEEESMAESMAGAK